MVPSEIQDTLWGLFSPLLGVTTIWERQDAERPALPYATLRMASTQLLNSPWYGEVDDDGNQTVYDTAIVTLSINRFGADSVAALETLRLRLNAQPVIDSFSLANVARAWTEQVLDTATLLDGRHWEPRATLDIYVRVTIEHKDWVSWIDTVNVVGEVGTVPVNIEINIKEAERG